MLTSSDDSDSDSFLVKMWILTRRRKRRYGVHPLNQERPCYGYFHQYYQRLKNYPERFFKYLRMSQPTFKYILNLIEPEIVKQLKIRPNIVNAISVEERLVLTLR